VRCRSGRVYDQHGRKPLRENAVACRLGSGIHRRTTDGATSVCRMAWLLGRGVFTTTLEASLVVAEVARRIAILEQLRAAVAPETLLTRASRLPQQKVRLSAAQWDLIRTTDGATSVCRMAWLLGRGVFTTTLEAYALIRLGILTTTDSPALAIRTELSFRDGLRGRPNVPVTHLAEADQTPHRTLPVEADAHAALPTPFGSDDSSAPTTKESRP
jgi:hypothetical protein